MSYRSLLKKLDFLHNRIAYREDGVPDAPDGLARGAILLGGWLFFILFGVLGLWAALAPLESAAIAPGQVILDSNKKTIQHLEGGIVSEILVKEDQRVKAGDPLVRLDKTAAQAGLDVLKSQLISLMAAESRLIAERDGASSITFPNSLLSHKHSSGIVGESLDSNRRLFDSRHKNQEAKSGILKQKIKQMKNEISGLRAQVSSASSQIHLLNQEIDVVRTLLESGNASKPRLLALERQRAALSGDRGDYRARISRAQQSIGEAEIELLNVQNAFESEVVAELKDTQTKISDLQERMKGSADTVSRVVITAPIAGRVTALKVHTVGGVIAPGAELMDIVPQDDKLIVEAQVQPIDIDIVRTGLVARVRLSAYRARVVPLLTGKVITVSAAKVVEERTGQSYYTARVEIDASELESLGEEVELYPGMPVETLIVTGSRTFLSYLFTPISESFNRSFRQQ